MKILCDVDQVECLRHGIDAPSSTIKIEVDPKSLTEEQRRFVADQIYDGLRFPNSRELNICPPTYEGFIAAINYGLEKEKIESRHTEEGALKYSPDLMKEIKEARQKLVSAAIKNAEKLRGSSAEIAGELTRMARGSLEKLKQQNRPQS